MIHVVSVKTCTFHTDLTQGQVNGSNNVFVSCESDLASVLRNMMVEYTHTIHHIESLAVRQQRLVDISAVVEAESV